MWKVPGSFECASGTDSKMANVSPVAVFSSCFGSRILCLDISMREEILICGDLHGNLVLFPLSNVLLNEDASKLERRILSLADFKGAHGISSVTSILIGKSSSYQIDLHTTGGDGCICSFNYNRDLCSLEFLGMKHVKELSLIQSIVTNSRSLEDSEQWHCAIGFTSTDFIIWNLKDESKMLQVPCGGWRRPYSYFLGCVPELQNCFAFLKDHKIHICKLWEPTFERPLFPQILNIQCHGREIHSSCFISIHIQQNLKKTKNLWVATGSEDGTVRLTRYRPDLGNWSASLLLGEHVGGSAVRSLCFISEIYSCGASQRCTSNGISMCNSLPNKDNYQCLLISVGAKQVLTLWLLKDRVIGNSVELHTEGSPSGRGTDTSMEECSSISFQWLSTHMPRKLNKVPEMRSNASKGKLTFQTSGTSPLSTETNLETSNAFMSGNDDWRYLAVTAFIVKGTDRLKVCFVVVACSDATLTLRALLLPQRFWFDVASLVSQVSPVLSLQHVVIPTCHRTECNEKITNLYIVVSGSTDGTIAFWDLTLTVDQFMQCVLKLQLEKMTSSQGRPRTGRGSQGGRWWKSLDNYSSKKGFVDASKGMPANLPVEKDTVSMQPCGFSSEPASGLDSIRMYNEAANGSRMHVSDRSSFPGETHELQPLHVLRSVHQSGVNCLHVSKVMHYEDESKPSSICCVVSGGDDQALSCFFFDVAIPVSMQCVAELNEDGSLSKSPSVGIRYVWECYLSSVSGYQFRVLHSHKVISAHSSAVKGVWSDGIWAFSTGLDQRIRFWRIDGTDCVRLSEHAHLIISVPEPESLDAVTCDGSLDRYQIVVTGRGMQMVEFSP